jgi:hypothetical protein
MTEPVGSLDAVRKTFASQSTLASRQLLVSLLRAPQHLVDLRGRDLDFALRIARRARLLGRLAWSLRERDLLGHLDRQARDQLESALVAVEARTRLATWELDRVDWALRGRYDGPLIALKGSAYVLAGLPNSRGRPFADVDLLVRDSALASVETALRERGWRPHELTAYDENYYRAWAHEIPALVHPEREVEVDLHRAILMRTARLRPSTELLVAASRRIPESRFSVLAPVDMVLHATVHLLYGGEMDDELRELVDIDELLRHFAGHEPGFWQQFWPRAVELDLARPAFYGLRYAARLLQTPVPDSVLQQSRTAAPPAPVLALMDALVPAALFPQHPDMPRRSIQAARLLLYMRSHWVRMPPVMLAKHLAYKACLRRKQSP